MHASSPGRHGDIIETVDAFIAAMRGIALSRYHFIHRWHIGWPDRANKQPYSTHADTRASKHEVEIMYSGHTNVSLKMTSERMAIPDGRYTLGQLLCSLYKRGDQWADEIDDDNLVCTVNGREAQLFDTIEAGAEVRISS
jgi:hypothetical protein